MYMHEFSAAKPKRIFFRTFYRMFIDCFKMSLFEQPGMYVNGIYFFPPECLRGELQLLFEPERRFLRKKIFGILFLLRFEN